MSSRRPKMHRPALVSGLLSAILRGTPAEKRLREGRIWLVWDQAVGEKIARHAQPTAFRDGTLTLAVDSAPWMQQLNFLKRELIAKVNDELGEQMVKDIFMKAGAIRVAPKAATEGRKKHELSPDELNWVKEQTESVSDPELRAVLESLIRKDRENQ